MVPESGKEAIVTCGVRGRVSMVPESANEDIVISFKPFDELLPPLWTINSLNV